MLRHITAEQYDSAVLLFKPFQDLEDHFMAGIGKDKAANALLPHLFYSCKLLRRLLHIKFRDHERQSVISKFLQCPLKSPAYFRCKVIGTL